MHREEDGIPIIMQDINYRREHNVVEKKLNYNIICENDIHRNRQPKPEK